MIETKALKFIAENTDDPAIVATIEAFRNEYERNLQNQWKEIKRLRKNHDLSKKAHIRYSKQLKEKMESRECEFAEKLLESNEEIQLLKDFHEWEKELLEKGFCQLIKKREKEVLEMVRHRIIKEHGQSAFGMTHIIDVIKTINKLEKDITK